MCYNHSNMNWSKATDIALIAALATFAVFAVLGLYQWISRKSLKKVDKPLVKTLVPFALMAATYFVFDKILIWNTRPDGSGEPSFPSSHVMVVATIFALVAINLPRYIAKKPLRIVLYCIMAALTIFTAVGRVAADKHWISDVIGAFIFAGIFVAIYYLIARKDLKHE